MAAQLSLEEPGPPVPAAPVAPSRAEGEKGGDSWMAKMREQATAKAQARQVQDAGDEQENMRPEREGSEMDAFERRRAARAAAGATSKDWIREMKEEAKRRQEVKAQAAVQAALDAEEEEEAMRVAAEEEEEAKARQRRAERQRMLASSSAFSRSEMKFNQNAEGGYARRMREAEEAARMYEQMRRDVEDLERERAKEAGASSWREEAHQREAGQYPSSSGTAGAREAGQYQKEAGQPYPSSSARAPSATAAPPPPPSGPGAPAPNQAAVGARLERETRGMDLAAVLRHFGFDPGLDAKHDALRSCYKRAALAMHPDRNQPAVVGAEQAALSEERWKIITNRMDTYLKVLEQKAKEAQT